MANEISGGCLCGAVQYRAAGPTLFCAHCHCRFCRAAHGAAFVTWFGVREEAFAIVAGEDKLQWYASSKQSRRGFCAACGSTMFFASTVSPGEMHIALASVDGAIDRAPQAHVFFDQHVEWIEVKDDLPRLVSDAPQLAKYRKIEPHAASD